MKQVSLIQVGFGTVGGALIEQVVANRSQWRERFGLDIVIAAVAGRGGAAIADASGGLDDATLRRLVVDRRAGSGAPAGGSLAAALPGIAAAAPTILLDAAAGEGTVDLDLQALDLGAGLVLSNKAPLALPQTDPRTGRLWAETASTGRLKFEATCGAGLPVISTLHSLLDTGDQVREISGTLSGTFGAIFSAVGGGAPFSDAVRNAKTQGYTEPDPRDDLSGLDVARKGLILSRAMGRMIDLDDIAVESLVPAHLVTAGIDEYLDRLVEQDAEIAVQAEESAAAGMSLKYVMRWREDEGVSVGLGQVPRSTVLGALQGPENIVSFRTDRYDQYPCVISGPGAGAAVTAAGMLADMLQLAHRIG